MQGGPISGTFPGQTSQLCFPSTPQSHIPSSQQADPLHEIHTANGSSSYSLSDNLSTDTHRLNGDSPWTPLDAASHRSQGPVPGDVHSRFSKRRRLNNNLNPDELQQYLSGPRSDSGYQTWSDATPYGFTFSDPGHLPAQRYGPSSFTSSADENYVCSSSCDPRENIGDDVSQSMPERDSSEIADNEPRTWHCQRKDCSWTGKCESEYKSVHNFARLFSRLIVFRKHERNHTRPFKCHVPDCDNSRGFPTLNDLERHQHSKHDIQTEGTRPKFKICKCLVAGCPKAEHSFKRPDNFKAHVKRMHPQENVDHVMKMCVFPSSNDRIPINDICSRSEDHFHLQQAQNRREAALREDSSQQLTSPVDAANNSEMVVPEPWNVAVKPPYSMNRQSSARLPLRNDTRHLTGAANSQPIRSNLTVPPFQQVRTTMTPSSHSHVQTMHQFPKGQSSPSMSHTPSSPGVSELPGQEMTDLSPSDVSPKGPIPQPGTHGQSAPSDTSRCIDSARSIDNQNFEHQPASSTARPAEGPNELFQLIQTMLSSNPDPSARNALPRLLRMMHSGNASLSNSGSLNSPKLTITESISAIVSKPPANCHLCPQKFTRKCDLKKHLKRHNKPYYCTYQNCKSKPFGSKADWKRHENTQHFQLECWQCPEPPSSKDAGNGSCGKLFFRRETFLNHLKSVHQLNDDADLKRLAKDKKIGRDGHRSFWCGFCHKIVRLQEKGLKGVEERFDHLENHFMDQQRKGHKGLRGWQNPPHGVGVSDDESVLDDDSSETETSSGSGTSEEEERDGNQRRRLQTSQTKNSLSVRTSTAVTDHIRSSPTTNKELMVKCCSCFSSYLLANITKCLECQHDRCRMCEVRRVSAEKESSFFQ